MSDIFNILVAKCGRTIGLSGYIKLNIYTDFIGVFHKGAIFRCGDMFFTVEDFKENHRSIKFVEINDIDAAKSIVSMNLYTTRQDSISSCALNDNEFFWFDIVGLDLVDDGYLIGRILDIERIGSIDYLLVKPLISSITSTRLPQSFLIPFIDRYIMSVDVDNGIVNTTGALGILERS